MALIAGCDEAGRGPILGPMVLAAVAIEEKDIPKLAALGVKDSKMLTPKKREELYPKIKELAQVEIAIVDAAEIDMRRAMGTNLNQIEAMKIAQLLIKLKPAEAYIDSPHPGDSQKFEEVIRSSTLEPINTIMYCEHKCDVNYPICSAASIIAKVERDRIIEKIKQMIGFEFGSGYIADPITKNFVENNSDAASAFIRKSWAPFKDLQKKAEQKSLFDY